MRPPTDNELLESARRLGRRLTDRGWQMASAESCTGGLVGHVITQEPRSSGHFLGGIVSYSDAVKEQLLGVSPDVLSRVGAVSAAVAEAMTAGVLDRFPVARLAVAVTGIAGPGGGIEDKPVGTVWIAWAQRGAPPQARGFRFDGDRAAVREQSAAAAMSRLLEMLQDG